MYFAEVRLERKIMGIRLFEEYEHALADVINRYSELYTCLPEEKITDFSTPKLHTMWTYTLGFRAEFEFEYQNGVTVCLGSVLTAEEAMRRRISEK